MAFLLPWYFFLFIGAFDWGYYAHALISVESAARTIALYTSTDASTTAVTSNNDTITCRYAREELKITPNVTDTTTCTALPVIVTYAPVTGAASADGNPASEVSVTYQTIRLIPIPGRLANQISVRRVVQMRLRG